MSDKLTIEQNNQDSSKCSRTCDLTMESDELEANDESNGKCMNDCGDNNTDSPCDGCGGGKRKSSKKRSEAKRNQSLGQW